MAETMNIYYLMRPCVVGFVFIAGWFGIRSGESTINFEFPLRVSAGKR